MEKNISDSNNLTIGLSSLGDHIGSAKITSSLIISGACLFALFSGTPDIQDAIINGLSPRQDFMQAADRATALEPGQKTSFSYQGRSYDITPSPAPR